jgi:hypothetical protein
MGEIMEWVGRTINVASLCCACPLLQSLFLVALLASLFGLHLLLSPSMVLVVITPVGHGPSSEAG